MSGKINVLEYEDRLVFKNEGTFIPETIEAALESGYKPPLLPHGNQRGNGGVPAAHDVARKANLVLVCMFHWLLPFSHGLHSAIEI